MNYTFEIGSDAVIYIISFIKIGSGIQNLLGDDTHTNTQKAR
jgi:hypothetical protein